MQLLRKNKGKDVDYACLLKSCVFATELARLIALFTLDRFCCGRISKKLDIKMRNDIVKKRFKDFRILLFETVTSYDKRSDDSGESRRGIEDGKSHALKFYENVHAAREARRSGLLGDRSFDR